MYTFFPIFTLVTFLRFERFLLIFERFAEMACNQKKLRYFTLIDESWNT